jgi:DNA-binding SARP family transcriptional activator
MEGPAGNFDGSDLPGHQGRLAFAALAVDRRPLAHEHLASIVWDDDPPGQWKSALAAVISKARSLISLTGLDGAAVLVSTGGTYSFSPSPQMWIDLEQAYRRLDRAEGSLRHDDPMSAAQEATVASAILRRPFLPGESGLWLEEARSRQSDALYRCYVTLAAAWRIIGDHQLAAAIAESAILVDPYRELGHRLLIEIEQERGDSGAAVRAFNRCERILRDEMGVRLSPETLRLADRLFDNP